MLQFINVPWPMLIRGYDHSGKVREDIAICLHRQWAPLCDVSVTYIKPSMFLLSKFLLCNECCRIVDKYYRQNKEVTVITLVWSICSNWITASELDLEIIRCSQPWNHVTHGNYRSLLFGYAVILMLLFLVKRKSWKQFQGLLTKEKLSHRHAYKSLFKSYNNG